MSEWITTAAFIRGNLWFPLLQEEHRADGSVIVHCAVTIASDWAPIPKTLTKDQCAEIAVEAVLGFGVWERQILQGDKARVIQQLESHILSLWDGERQITKNQKCG
jgi:hypothetical protein